MANQGFGFNRIPDAKAYPNRQNTNPDEPTPNVSALFIQKDTPTTLSPQRRLTRNLSPNLADSTAALGGTFPLMLRVTLITAR